jgi:hypothetical protein
MSLHLLKLLTCLDVNPNNIFVSHIDGTTPVAKLGDLGSSKCTVLSLLSSLADYYSDTGWI